MATSSSSNSASSGLDCAPRATQHCGRFAFLASFTRCIGVAARSSSTAAAINAP